MKKGEINMITKFDKLFEQSSNSENRIFEQSSENRIFEKNIDLTDIIINVENEDKDLIEKIKHELSIITYKRKNSPKSIRIKGISGYFKKRDFKNVKLTYRTYIVIDMSNGDKIKGKLSVYQDENENNIHLKINDDIVYDLDNKKYDSNFLIEKLIYKYKEYLLKDYKIR